jgi:hypothetical protein
VLHNEYEIEKDRQEAEAEFGWRAEYRSPIVCSKKKIQVDFSQKTGTSTPLFITKKNHNSDTNTILPLF